MCLVVFAVAPDDEHTLILAGNRDEFHARPTSPLHWWDDAPGILGGRDLKAGGTWLAAHANGRFATVTNFRDAEPTDAALPSRGLLVTDFLVSTQSPIDYLVSLRDKRYAGYNLLVSDGDSVAYGSNRDGEPRQLGPGIYAVSNARLDTPWHKVKYAREALGERLADGRLDDSSLFDLLSDRSRAKAADVDSNRLPFELAHAVTAPFIVQPEYGTRSSTIARLLRSGERQLAERQFDAAGQLLRETQRRYFASPA